MRINTNVYAMNTHRQYGINTKSVSKATEKLSSGYRVNRAGDDAAGLAISEKMRAQIRGLNMASKNSSDAVSLVRTAEAALQETHNVLQRMRELAVQSRSDTNETSVDRAALNAEFQQLIKEIDDTAAKTRFNDKGVINGDYQEKFLSAEAEGAVSIGFFSLASETNSVFALAIRTVQTENGPRACGEITFEDYTVQVFAGESYTKLDNIEMHFESLLGDGVIKQVSYSQSHTYADSEVQDAAEELFLFHAELYRTFVDKTYMPSGSVVVPAGFTTGLQSAADTAFNNRLHDLATLDREAAYAARYALEYNPAYAAEEARVYQQAHDASYATFVWQNAYDLASQQFDIAGETASQFGSIHAANYNTYKAEIDAANRAAYEAAYDPGVHDPPYASAAAYADAMIEQDTIDRIQSEAAAAAGGVRHTYATNVADMADVAAQAAAVAAGNQAKIDNVVAIRAYAYGVAHPLAQADGDAAYAAGLLRTDYIADAEVYGTNAANAYLRNNQHRLTSGTPLESTGGMAITVTEGVALTIQSGANQGDEAHIYIDRMDAWHLGVEGESIATGKEARQAIRFVNNAINRVSMQRAHLGAMQNRLEHKIQNLDSSAENLSAAESRIRDLDMAKEMSAFTKAQILIQASTAMLAQANAIPQNVLALVG